MKKFFSLMCASLLILGACSDDNKEPNPGPGPNPGPSPVETEYATFGTPEANAVYSNNTYSWSANTDNLMPMFEFADGELADYKSLTFTINKVEGRVKMMYEMAGVYGNFKNSDGNEYFNSNGTVVIDLTNQNIDLSKVTSIAIGGETSTGSVEIEASKVYLSPDEVETPGDQGIATGKGTITYGYCMKEINYKTGMNSSGTTGVIGGAIYIPASVAEAYKGNLVTAAIVGYGTSSTPEIELFISEGRDGVDMDTPVYTQKAEMELQNDWNEVTLDTPYEITGKGFYIGYNTPVIFGDLPLALDLNYTSENDYASGNFDNGAWIGVNNEWVNGGPWFGRVCLQIQISGDSLPLYTISVSDLFIPSFMTKDYEFPMDFYLTNTGIDAVENVTLSVKVNGEEVAQAVAKAETPVQSGEGEWLTAYGIKVPEVGTDMNVEVQVIKVNGNAGITGQPVMTGTMSVSETSFEPNVLIEEFTSTLCIWCPRGIVGMEYMAENYGNAGFIGIAGHSNALGTDPMTAPTYSDVPNAFSAAIGLPSAVANRSYLFDPNIENNEMYYDYLRQYPSFGQITLDATYNESTGMVTVSSETEFALDLTNSPYQLTFVLCQNNVGPYPQYNIFSGGKYGPMGGWENYGDPVMWTFQEVARYAISPLYGINNSLPSNIKKGEKYTYSANLNATGYNIDNCYVVGIIVDSTNAQVLNSSKFYMNGDNHDAGSTRSLGSSKMIKNRGNIIESRIGFQHETPKQPTRNTVKSSAQVPSTLRGL